MVPMWHLPDITIWFLTLFMQTEDVIILASDALICCWKYIISRFQLNYYTKVNKKSYKKKN